jgi:hypothetical protein
MKIEYLLCHRGPALLFLSFEFEHCFWCLVSGVVVQAEVTNHPHRFDLLQHIYIRTRSCLIGNHECGLIEVLDCSLPDAIVQFTFGWRECDEPL